MMFWKIIDKIVLYWPFTAAGIILGVAAFSLIVSLTVILL